MISFAGRYETDLGTECGRPCLFLPGVHLQLGLCRALLMQSLCPWKKSFGHSCPQFPCCCRPRFPNGSGLLTSPLTILPGMMTLALKTLAKSQEEPTGLKALHLLKDEQQQWLRRLARAVPLRAQILGACGCRECPDRHSFNSETYLAASVCSVQ